MDDWKDDLGLHLKEQKKTKKEIKQKKVERQIAAKKFLQGEVLPAFDDLKREFKKHKRDVEIDNKKNWAVILVKKNKHKEFVYEINISADDDKLLASKSVYVPNDKGKLKLGVEGKIHNSANSMQINRVKKEDIIKDFLDNYKAATRISE